MRRLALIGICMLGLCASHAPALTELRTVAQDNSAPKFVLKPTGTTGFCVDALRAIEKVDGSLHFSGEERSEPTPRIEQRLAAGSLDVACGLARNDSRLARATFIEPALFEAKYVLVVRADDPVDIGTLDDIRKLGAEGTILGAQGLSVMANLAREGGLIVDDASILPDANLRKLMLGRGRFFLFRSPGVNAVIREAGLEGKVRVLPNFVYTTRLYLIASKRLPHETIGQLERAITELHRRGELARIYARWRALDR